MKYITWDIERLADLVALWNRELEKDFPMRPALFEQNSFDDDNICIESSLIAVNERDEVVGFVVAKRWQELLGVEMNREMGWIQVLLVDDNYRNRGIGSHLLSHAENTLKSKGIKKVSLGRDPKHYFPGIPSDYENVAQWFIKKGYQKQGHGTDYDLICKYDQDDKKSAKIPSIEGVQFSIMEKNDKADLLAFLHRSFPGRWEYESTYYFTHEVDGREFVVLKKNNKIIGFCRINDAQSPIIAQNVYWAPLFDDELGGIGPLGIDANERKQGYGLAIVEAGIAFLRKRGIKRIVIDWTGLVDFYSKLGYEIWKSYDNYGKKLVE
ncbi:MAG TPA: GNAT family N-acetyltransferase [Bacillota bacterium]|nr:GNAT family N-acetyltransferase [Bacillota bacterium]